MSLSSVRIRGLDTLRSLAILVVIVWHMHYRSPLPIVKTVGPYGWAGVDLFFALSGYLIGSQLLRTLRATGTLRLRDYYWRRAWRILPAFWAVLAIYWLWPACREGAWRTPVWRYLTFTQNFGLSFGAFSHAWSLCIEDQFYWALPLILLALRGRARAGGALVLGMVVGGMLLRGWLWWPYAHGPAEGLTTAYYRTIYYPTYARLDGLIGGVVLAWLRQYRSALWQRFSVYADAVTVLGGSLVALALHLFDENYALTTVVFGFPLLSLGCTLLVGSAASERGWLATTRVPGTSGLATLAFTIYLTHKQVLFLVRNQWPALAAHPWLQLVVFALAIISVSLLLHFLIERPALAWRDRAPHVSTKAFKRPSASSHWVAMRSR